MNSVEIDKSTVTKHKIRWNDINLANKTTKYVTFSVKTIVRSL
jgi:hypothetical protein